MSTIDIRRVPPLTSAFGRRAALLPGIAFILAGAVPAAAQQPASGPRAAAMIVLDGSNSMNARLPNDKSAKYLGVRDAIRASLPKIAGTEVGLAAFGARRPNDCNDAEVATAPSTDQAPLLSALERFQPRGFSPVVLALRNAAKALPANAEKASLVLVLDDLASCRGEDPCAVATALKRDIPSLAVHVVVLGPRPVDLPVLACMVKQTGGQLFQVTDGLGIAPAIDEVLSLAGMPRQAIPQVAAAVTDPTRANAEPRQGPPVPTPAPRAGQRPDQRPDQRPGPTSADQKPSFIIDQTQPGLHLTTRLVDGAPLLLVPVEWRIWRAEARSEEGNGNAAVVNSPLSLVEEVTAPGISRQLPNGRYEIEAKAGLVKVRRAIEVTQAGPTTVVLDLNASLLAISAPIAKGADPASTTVLEVRSEGTQTAPVWVARKGSHDLVVPPGSYRIVARDGLAFAERVLSLGPGVTGQVDLTLQAGRLIVEEQTPAAHPSPSVQMLLETDDASNSGNRREVFRAAANRMDVTLPAGAYVLTVQRGSAETRDRVQVRPGEVVQRSGVLPSARVRLEAVTAPSLPRGLPVSYRIERLDSPGRSQVAWGETSTTLELVPGRYRIEARLGGQNAVSMRELELRAAPAEQRIELALPVGALQLRLNGSNPGLGFGEVYWQVVAETGDSVWRTSEREPVLVLRPGRYRIQAELRDSRLEAQVDVRAGDNRVVEIGG